MGNIGKNIKYLDVVANEAIYRDQRDHLPEASKPATEQEDTHDHA